MAKREPQVKAAMKAGPDFSTTGLGTRPRTAPIPEADETLAKLGEFLRRTALGLVAMLFVIRAYFPSEDAETGSGLVWVFAVLGTAAIGIASSLCAGSFRFRWSWADAAVLVLMILVAVSASHAAERRPAITMAWEWGALGILYCLVRNLPRTRSESATLAGAVVATAVAVAAYGLYQVPFELPRAREALLKNPDLVLSMMGFEPNTPSAEALKQRLLYSTEAFSTFALANSLAGFLVGPMALMFAVALENLKRDGKGSRVVRYLAAAIPGLVVLICLILTKSRSAWIGLFVALLVLAWRARHGLPRRVLAISGISLAILLGGLIAGGVATRQLDPEVITQASKSLRYRWEYWVGTWGVITEARSQFASTGQSPLPSAPEIPEAAGSSYTFWSGVGPANFAVPYLRHKLPQASEEILDPHNMVLEVWATAGVFAMLALLAALAIGLRDILGPSREPADEGLSDSLRPAKPTTRSGSGWLLAVAGLGWIGVWAFGKLNPMIHGDLLARWLILGMGWGLAVALGAPLWGRRPIPAAGLGVGVLALSINLLAAGGIGMPAVAMALWLMLAIGLNLREDRPCGRLREVDGILPVALLACIWAALAGTFYGAVLPFWKSEAERALGDAALAAKPPAYETGRDAYLKAIQSDRYNVRPWVGLANLEFAFWRSPEVSNRKEPRMMRVLISLDKALDPTERSPTNLGLRRQQARFARAILKELPPDAKAEELLACKYTIVKACRWIARIYPTSATARADLAQASADIGMYPDAIREAKQALLLDELTPHLDKKLPRGVRPYLEAQLPRWETQAKEPPPTPPSARPRDPSRPGGPRP